MQVPPDGAIILLISLVVSICVIAGSFLGAAIGNLNEESDKKTTGRMMIGGFIDFVIAIALIIFIAAANAK